MRVLIACEESQEVCKAFRKLGHEAYSCDLQACSGGHPEWHIMHDAVEVAHTGLWDLMIAHPPCTYFAAPGMHYLKTRPERMGQLNDAFEFLRALWNSPIDKIAIENPIGWLNTNWRKPNQKVHPYYFGDNEMKATCLWLKGLSRLNGLPAVAMNPSKFKPEPDGYTKPGKDGYSRGIYFCGRLNAQHRGNHKAAAKLKSKTFPGIANAMALQWGGSIINLNQ